MCPRPTPTWQKGIGDFFGGPGRKPEKENQLPVMEDEEEAGGSGVSKAPRKYVSAHTELWVFPLLTILQNRFLVFRHFTMSHRSS